MRVEKINCEGKRVFVGIDVHKSSYSISAICGEVVVKTATVEANPVQLADSLSSWFPNSFISSAYEAGFSGFNLHRTLEEKGINSLVVNPASIQIAANNRVKTDRRDSLKIAQHLSANLLKSIYIPAREEEARRTLTRTRQQVVEIRADVARQIKSKLEQFGVSKSGDTRVMSNRLLKEVEKLTLPDEVNFSLSLHIEHWRFLTRQLFELRKKIKEYAEGNRIIATYKSVPGIGDISAAVLANELGDMSRFVSVKGLYSYTGLTPCEYSSGEAVRRGHITRQGSHRVRHILVEVAWRAVRKDEALKKTFERIAATRGKNRAIVAVARKLIGRIRACMRDKAEYELSVA